MVLTLSTIADCHQSPMFSHSCERSSEPATLTHDSRAYRKWQPIFIKLTQHYVLSEMLELTVLYLLTEADDYCRKRVALSSLDRQILYLTAR
jgi:hypothetical protein